MRKMAAMKAQSEGAKSSDKASIPNADEPQPKSQFIPSIPLGCSVDASRKMNCYWLIVIWCWIDFEPNNQ